MKTIDTTKKTVLAIGIVSVVAGLVGLYNASSLMEQFFPLYTGMTLMGTVLLHKEPLKKAGDE